MLDEKITQMLLMSTSLLILFNQTVSAGLFSCIVRKGCPKSTPQTPQLDYVPLEKPTTQLDRGKEGLEAELAFATLPLGFVNWDTESPPGMIAFVKDYIKLKEGNETKDNQFTPAELNVANTSLRTARCKAHLREPVLMNNHIFYDKTADPSTIEYGHKTLYFDYYTNEPQEVSYLKCPIKFYNQKQFLYFGGLGWHSNRPDEPLGHYFVITDSPHQPGRLTILMRTRFFAPNELPMDPESSEMDSLWHESSHWVNFIRLVPQNGPDGRFQLYGMDAERAYITGRYGFVSHDRAHREAIDQLIKYVEILKKGYEANYWHLRHSLFNKLNESEKRCLCEHRVRQSEYLQSVMVAVDHETSVQQIQIVRKTIIFPHLQLPPQQHKVVCCPVILGPQLKKTYLYFKDVFYEGESKHQLRHTHRFVLMDTDVGDNIRVVALSKIDDTTAGTSRQVNPAFETSSSHEIYEDAHSTEGGRSSTNQLKQENDISDAVPAEITAPTSSSHAGRESTADIQRAPLKSFAGVFGKCCPKTPSSQERQMQFMELTEQKLLSNELVGMEAELAYLTLSIMGSANADVLPKPGILAEYLRLREGNTVRLAILTHEVFESHPHKVKVDACKAYLHEPVLMENNIYYRESGALEIKHEEKQLLFDYYTRDADTVLVTRCPIIHNNQEKYLYFGVLGWHEDQNVEPDAQYLVMAESPSEAGSLVVVMRTSVHPQDNPTVKDPSELKSTNADTSASLTRLTVPTNLQKDPSRFFAMDAERAYLSLKYGFVHHDRSKSKTIDKLIEYVEIFKTGHETFRSNLDASVFNANEEMEKFRFCWHNIDKNDYLLNAGIRLDENGYIDEVRVVEKTITYPRLKLLPRLRRRMIQCPAVMSSNGKTNKIMVYFETVEYDVRPRHPEKADLFVLFDSPTDDSDTVYVAAFTKPRNEGSTSTTSSGRLLRRPHDIGGSSAEIQEISMSQDESSNGAHESDANKSRRRIYETSSGRFLRRPHNIDDAEIQEISMSQDESSNGAHESDANESRRRIHGSGGNMSLNRADQGDDDNSTQYASCANQEPTSAGNDGNVRNPSSQEHGRQAISRVHGEARSSQERYSTSQERSRHAISRVISEASTFHGTPGYLNPFKR